MANTSVFAARVRAVPRHLRALGSRLSAVPDIERQPANPLAWIAAANARINELDPDTVARIGNHDLRRSSYVTRLFLPEISQGAGATLKDLHRSGVSPATITAAVNEIIRWKTIAECAYSHRAGSYFDEAESVMTYQWQRVIWPIIRDEDFTHTLDLACGRGRNSEMLKHHAKTIDLVDINTSCLKSCRDRFGDKQDGCAFRYHSTDGNGLPGIPDASISFVYSWDSMVHFDRAVIRAYLREIKRVLESGGSAFLHHSNFGSVSPNSDWRKNHGSRSDMTAELMQEYAEDVGLRVKFQRLSGMADGWGIDNLDCLTLLSS